MRLSSLLLTIPMLLAGVAGAHAEEPASRALREADGAVHFADLAGRRLLGLLDGARLGGDQRQMRCVDVKLTQVNSFGRILLGRRDRLVRAEASGDEPAARHERMVIRNLHAQVRRLEREGRACVFPGADSGDGRTIVEVIVDRSVPDEDPSLLTDEERRRGW